MSIADSIDALLHTKQSFEDNESDVLARCPDDTTRGTVRAAVVRARDNYNAAINKVLCADDVLMRGLIGDIEDNRRTFEDLVEKDGHLAMVLNGLSTGVMIGAKIVALLK